MGCCAAKLLQPEEAEEILRKEWPDMLFEEERVEYAFQYPRDQVYLTTHRILRMNVKGLGDTKGWTTIPYTKIAMYSIDGGGMFDVSMDIEIHTIGSYGHFQINLQKEVGRAVLIGVMRLLSNRMFNPSGIGKKFEQPPLQEPLPDAASTFVDFLTDTSKEIDPKYMEETLKTDPAILAEGETVQKAFRCWRDTTVFTSNRCIVINKKGLTGKRVKYTSYLWQCFRAFSVETAAETAGAQKAGASVNTFFDRNCTIRFWTTLGEENRVFEQDLRRNVDLLDIQKFFSDKILGMDTVEVSAAAIKNEGLKDTGANFFSFFGNDMRMIDAAEMDVEFKTQIPILQNCEHVELAFKARKDVTLFTTKRVIFVQIPDLLSSGVWAGMISKKTTYLSVPWTTVQAFALQSAGSFLDKDAKIFLWTDIAHEPQEKKEKPPPPLPGMSFLEISLQKDKVDVKAICRYLASRIAKLGSESSQPPRPSQEDMLTKADPGDAQKFLDWLGNNARQVDPVQMEQHLKGEQPLLFEEEHVQMAFICGRDSAIFTTHRFMKIDVNGLLSTKTEYFSIPYKNLRGYMIMSSGNGFDLDSRLELYFKAPWFEWQNKGDPAFKQEFSKSGANIIALQKFLSEQTMGNCDGKTSLAPGMVPPPPSTPGQLLSILNNESHQIDSAAMDEKFHADPDLLLPDEQVLLAFKCGRDMYLYTTKRFMKVNVHTSILWGTRIDYTTVPFKRLPIFEVETSAGAFNRSMSTHNFTDTCGKVSLELRKGKCNPLDVYKLMLSKCVSRPEGARNIVQLAEAPGQLAEAPGQQEMHHDEEKKAEVEGEENLAEVEGEKKNAEVEDEVLIAI